MKHVILILTLLFSGIAFGQEITSTQQYEALINKADSELKEAQKLRDAKVRKATELYIKALDKKKKAVMVEGDLDKANKIQKEIDNLKPLVATKVVKVVPKTDPNNDVDVDVDTVTTADREKALGYKLKKHPIGAKLGPNGHYYKFIDGFSTWRDAYNKAKEMGGYLAVITDSEEYVFIAKLAKINNKSNGKDLVWFGGTMYGGNIKWITKEEQNKGLRHNQFSNNYTHCCLGSLEEGLRPARPNGLSGKGIKVIKGYVIEWDN